MMRQVVIVVKDRERITHLCMCPNKHTLERHEALVPKSAWIPGSMCSHKGHRCDGCHFQVPKGHTVLRCEACDFDLCEWCLSEWPSPTVLKIGDGHCGSSCDEERIICADVRLNPGCVFKHFHQCHMCAAECVVGKGASFSQLMDAGRKILKEREAAKQETSQESEGKPPPLQLGQDHCGCEWYGNTCASAELNPAWIGKLRFFRCHYCEERLLVERGGPKCGVPGHKCGIGDANHCGQPIRYPWHVLGFFCAFLKDASFLFAGTLSGVRSRHRTRSNAACKLDLAEVLRPNVRRAKKGCELLSP